MAEPAQEGPLSEILPLHADSAAQLTELSECLQKAVSENLKQLGKEYPPDVVNKTNDALIKHLIEPAMEIITKNVRIDGGLDASKAQTETQPYDDLLNRNVIYLQEDVLSQVGANCARRSEAPKEIVDALRDTLAASHSSLEERQRAFSEKPPVPASHSSVSIPDKERALQDLDMGVSYLEGLVELLPEYLERARRTQRVQADLAGLVKSS